MVEFTVFKGSESGKIVRANTQREIGPREVLVKITHSGLCFTDVHFKHSDIALGHEGAGVVQELGRDVTRFKKGDRVGWGYNHSSCGTCAQCLRGRDTLCADRALYGTADLDQGSMATHGVWKDGFLFPIPSALPSDVAAPLMCGGATVFNALHLHNVQPTERVGVIGIGGLGHLAIQFAAKMGCSVSVFSGSDSKKSEAISLGATDFYAMKSLTTPEEVAALIGDKTIDHLLVTTSRQPDWRMYLPIMTRGGTIYPISVSAGNLEIEYTPLIDNALRIQGCLVADRLVHSRMLEFAARHGVSPILQRFRLDEEGIEEAFGVLGEGTMRYRGVLVAEP